MLFCFLFFKQKTAYEMRISDWSSDVCSSDLFGDQMGRRIRETGSGAPGQIGGHKPNILSGPIATGCWSALPLHAPWAGGRAGGTRREGVHAEGLSFKKACCPPNSSDPRSPGAAGTGKSNTAGLIPLVSRSEEGAEGKEGVSPCRL